MTGCLSVSVSETSMQSLPDSTPQVATEQREKCVSAWDGLRCDRRQCLVPHCDREASVSVWLLGYVVVVVVVLHCGGLTDPVCVSVGTGDNIRCLLFTSSFEGTLTNHRLAGQIHLGTCLPSAS